jgi:hypothetical protein
VGRRVEGAGAESINVSEVVAASGDGQSLSAWRALAGNTLDVNGEQPGP